MKSLRKVVASQRPGLGTWAVVYTPVVWGALACYLAAIFSMGASSARSFASLRAMLRNCAG